jgi:hypothetical protein
MKYLLVLLLLGGFGYALNNEIQKETALQSQLDETRQQLDDAKKLVQALEEQQRVAQQQRNGGRAPAAQSMWNDPTNPLNARPTRAGH